MQPEIVKKYPFIDKWRANGYQYYVLPKDMLCCGAELGLYLDECFLYLILRDRMKLSFRNAWYDDSGEIFILYTRADAARYLGWSERKTISVFANLINAGLLLEKEQKSTRRGAPRKPKRLYLRRWVSPSALHSAESLKNGGFPLFSKDNIYSESDPYYIIPKVFFEAPELQGLKIRSIMLYAIALDKLHLSLSFGRVDPDGRVWCNLDNEAVAKELGCGKNSLQMAYTELQELGLLVRERPRDMSGYRIFLRDYLPPEGAKIEDSRNLHMEGGDDAQNLRHEGLEFAPRKSGSCIMDDQYLQDEKLIFASDKGRNLHPSQSLSYPFLSQPSLVSIGAGAPDAPDLKKGMDFSSAYANLQDRLDYPLFCRYIAIEAPERQDMMFNLLDQAIELMAKDEAMPGKYIRFGQEIIPKDTVMLRYRDIDLYVLYTLLRNLSGRAGDIKNMTVYLHKALLTAVEDHGAATFYTRKELEGS